MSQYLAILESTPGVPLETREYIYRIPINRNSRSQTLSFDNRNSRHQSRKITRVKDIKNDNCSPVRTSGDGWISSNVNLEHYVRVHV